MADVDTIDSGDPMLQWFAAQVWAGRESQCEQQLALRGYEVFLPRFRDRRKWSDRVKVVDRALFPGYVFCRLLPAALGKVVTAPGVIRIVGDGRQPLPVAPEEIDSLKRITEAGLTAEPWEFLRAGQVVSIIDGPLSGLQGIVIRVQGQERLIVSISLLQRSVAVEIHPAWVQRSPAAWIEGEILAQRARA